MKATKYFFFLFALILFNSCNKNEDEDFQTQYDKDIALIEDYLVENNLTAEKTSSGLYYIITNEGSGAYPSVNNTVTVQYSGYLLDGTKFDSGTSAFSLSGVIQGWQEGIPKFRTKGRGKLIMPSYLGYGASGSGSVPANAVLIFDIYLISFQ